MNWLSIRALKLHEGLGVWDPSFANIAMGVRIYWKLKIEPNVWWVLVLQSKCLRANDNRSTNGMVSQGSLTWKLVVTTSSLINDRLRWILGSGNKINLWEDLILVAFYCARRRTFDP